MTSKPFASSADLSPKQERFETIVPGVFAMSAQGDPNVGAIEGEDFLVCIEARATPVAARRWLERLREVTTKPVRYLVLSHYHAVRVLGASAFAATAIVAHQNTAELIAERGRQDWESEFARMPRLFEEPDSIPGLTHPTMTFADRLTIELGPRHGHIELFYLGRGHTRGDIVVWHPASKTLFAGDLVEAEAALYTGDAYHQEWASTTLDNVAALGAEHLVGGRGKVVHGQAEVQAAIEQSRAFLTTLLSQTKQVVDRGGSLKEAFEACYQALNPVYGQWPIFEHTIPFDVARVFDELRGVEHPVIWTAMRDREVWDQLQG
ncbi:MBL fold metallo-hydrolase [Ferrimicrobium sp.]|uniref:MBL fold metallo-hydrolase n=1 Tax=Ferrimicrobium sp. TaxID=2926050 RepID=UPI00261555F4|nr:MBL fold metallo-hydrolase [Ferrimicrobium sp.]